MSDKISIQRSPPPPCQHVVVCAFPFGTHPAPLLLLVGHMAASATDVRFTFLNTQTSNDTLFKAIDVTAYPNIVPRAAVPSDAPPGSGDPMAAINRFLEAAPECFRREMASAEAEVGVAISCVVSDAFLWFCGEIAEEKGVPWVPLWTAGPASLSAHFHTDCFRDRFRTLQGAHNEDEIANCAPGFSSVHFRDLPKGVVMGDLNSLFSQMLHKMGLMMPKATAVVINSFEELSSSITNDLKSKLKLLSVGPFPLLSSIQAEQNDQYGCLPWLDKQAPQSVAFISFGTVATPPQHELVALAEALEESGVPFIWSMSDSTKIHLPSSFLERISNGEFVGLIVPWAPQMKLLARPEIGVFITHCGWNSVIESIVNGVPLICKPILGDQMLNQHFIEFEYKFGVGIRDGGFTKTEVIKALHQVLSSEVGKQMRERVNMLKRLAQESTKLGATSNENFKSLMELVIGSRKISK